MGYKKQSKVYRLHFQDEEYTGLEVKARSVPLGTFLELTTLADAASGRKSGAEQAEKVARLFASFAEVLVSWNLEEEDGTPVPATLDGLRAQDFDFVLPIIVAWMDAISGVAVPLAKRSTTGDGIQEASLPMAPLSTSQES